MYIFTLYNLTVIYLLKLANAIRVSAVAYPKTRVIRPFSHL